MALPLNKMADCGAKPLPITLSTKPGDPAAMLAGLSEKLRRWIIGDAFAAGREQQRRQEYQPILKRILPRRTSPLLVTSNPRESV